MNFLQIYMNFLCLNNFLEFKSDNKIHKMEMTAAVALVDWQPARLGPAAAQMAITGPCQPGPRGGGATRSQRARH
jgi:hypothetical protein